MIWSQRLPGISCRTLRILRLIQDASEEIKKAGAVAPAHHSDCLFSIGGRSKIIGPGNCCLLSLCNDVIIQRLFTKSHLMSDAKQGENSRFCVKKQFGTNAGTRLKNDKR